ncbi:hypothetical protein [Halolamina salifodinae]|uniref:Uncharacterized protein n=1 Tax=Halolamina salifodinae TaxID=1202767 RepID=A0A8T4GXE2_9EURY|nr:hypothetical protein [Halolamina salifodinae]MBP1986753.1 hypothetical protein [Halolamina salifodinae]
MNSSHKRDVLVALVLTTLLTVVWLVVHELIHLAINVAATGEIATHGNFGPFSLEGITLTTHYTPGGVGAWNNLLTPVIVSLLGLVAVHYSDRIEWHPLRWAVAAVGITAWAHDALYSMGVLTIPVFIDGGVHHTGDGTHALAVFGPVAMIPGMLILGFGVWIVMGRVQYERG